MKCYAVIDTNVLVSALLSKDEKSATVQVLERVLNKEIIPVYSKEIIPVYSKEIMREYQEVLLRKKFGFSEKAIQCIISYIRQNGKTVVPTTVDEKLIDIKDLPFYKVVMDTRTKNSYLVTGNIKHFPKRDYIVSPRQLIDILENKS